MEDPAGEADDGSLRVVLDGRLKLEFHGSRINSDAGLLAFREPDDALGRSEPAGAASSERRRGRNTRHLRTGLFRQSVLGRLAGHEDVSDADRLAHDPAAAERGVAGQHRLDPEPPGGLAASRCPPLLRRRFYASVSYRAGSWNKPRRVAAKVEWNPRELHPRVGSIVTNLTRPAEWAVAFYNQLGTAEPHIREGKNAVAWTRPSCHCFATNAVRLQLHALAYNLANLLRTLTLPDEVKQWSMTTLRDRLMKIAAKILQDGRSVIFQTAGIAVPWASSQEVLGAIAALRPMTPARDSSASPISHAGHTATRPLPNARIAA